MRPIQKGLKLGTQEYYETHLAIINCLLPTKITPKEIEVLATFMTLRGDIVKDEFGTTARKIVRDRLNLSQGGLGNYMKSLKNKGFILEDKHGNLSIRDILIPAKEEQTYMFKLVNSEIN